jgi:acid stress-induced BolA-like protein IbaG/YrbA
MPEVQSNEIKSIIEQGITDSLVMLDGDGTHFLCIVVSDKFADRNMVQRHQMVYKTLGDKMGKEIHALSIRALTPDEWNRQKDFMVLD